MKENFCYKCGSDYESEYYKYDNKNLLEEGE